MRGKTTQTLGSQLRRLVDESRRNAKSDALFTIASSKMDFKPDALVVTEQDQKDVEAMFKFGIARLAKAIAEYEQVSPYVELASEGVASWKGTERARAMNVLRKACWPLTVPEGIQLSDNLFNQHWQTACEWARSQELALRLYEEHDTRRQQSTFCMAATALPG